VRREPVICQKCGAEMNHHADKLVEPRTADEGRQVDAVLGGVLLETHGCPGCGNVQSRRAAP
jgi:hypothetical protein